MALALLPVHAAAQDAPPLAVQQALNRVAADLFSTSPQPAVAIEALKVILAAYVASGRMDAGLKALREAATLDPARPETYVQLARAYRLNGQYDDALAHLRLAIPPGKEDRRVSRRRGAGIEGVPASASVGGSGATPSDPARRRLLEFRERTSGSE
jgi:tetratricopeptide (TPR) repeat protein